MRAANHGGRLLVIVEHRPSVLLKKGEYTARYYNPGNLFGEVHLLLLNDDQPAVEALNEAVGEAKLVVHNLPPPNFVTTLGWQKLLIGDWVASGVRLTEKIQPALMRVHNNFLTGYLAEQIKTHTGLPYALSIHHQHWERLKDNRPRTWLVRRLLGKFERDSTQEANAVIAVHKPVEDYAKRIGAKRVERIYNVVSDQIRPKQSYKLGSTPSLICINQQIKYKNPANIVRAISEIDCQLTLVGDGPEHDNLVRLAAQLGVADRVHFVRAEANADLVGRLPNYDLMVTHCDYRGIPKSILEGALAGLPIIVNRRQIPEYEAGWLRLVEDSESGYLVAIRELLASEADRAELGGWARKYAETHFDPGTMEARLAELYKQLSAGGKDGG